MNDALAASVSALGIITGALRRINVYAPGETLAPEDAQDALALLNDLVDSLSNEHLACYSRVESILTLQTGKQFYTIGNPVVGTLVGTTQAGSAVISGANAMPDDLVIGADVVGAGIPKGASVLAIDPVAETVTISKPATATWEALTPFSYTLPGDFKVARPLRILSNSFTRITSGGTSQLDYPFSVVDVERWSAIGIKNMPGPWPKLAYYDPLMPLGKVHFYPLPTMAGELHLWSDNLFEGFRSLETPSNLPQGYVRFLKIALAIELAPEYNRQPNAILIEQYAQAKSVLKSLNRQKPGTAPTDPALMGASQGADASWFLHGGFNF